MSGKRRDNKGRILKTGESQRKDMTYMYRYTDQCGSRQCVYAPTLQELRQKEEQIQKLLYEGIDYAAGNMTVADFLEKYLQHKLNLKPNSLVTYKGLVKTIRNDSYGHIKLRDVNVFETKELVLRLYNSGKSYSTIRHTTSILKTAFQTAVDDNAIRKNPASFKLPEVIPQSAERREGLTPQEKKIFLEYLAEHSYYKKYYSDVIILLETGLRIAELYGLTEHDVDFTNRYLNVNHQLIIPSTAGGVITIAEPKSKSGNRMIPLSDLAITALRRVLSERKYPSQTIDGYSDFLFVGRHGLPRRPFILQESLKRIVKEFNEKSELEKLPHITPHVLRHTFCSECIARGVDIKTVQYLMGHSSVNLLLDIYTHVNFSCVEQAIWRE